MNWKQYLLPVIFLFTITGCDLTGIDDRNKTGIDFVNAKIEMARDYLKCNQELNKEEIEFIENNGASYSVYMWGTYEGAFSWWWDLPTDRTVSVSYLGNIEVIDPNFVSSRSN